MRIGGAQINEKMETIIPIYSALCPNKDIGAASAFDPKRTFIEFVLSGEFDSESIISDLMLA